MSPTLKIILPIAVVIAVALGVYSVRSGARMNLKSSQQTSAQPTTTNNANNQAATTDAEIDAIVTDASAEPTGTGEEDKDSVLLTSDAEALTNFNNIYE